jgi:energy-converting hydrogenase B subunit D
MILLDAIHIILPVLMIVSALIAVYLKDLVAATIALASMSLLLSLEFYILQAPDVAIAEAGVGAALTTAILILAIKATKRTEEEAE